jgi:hypothetical protein
VNPWLTSGTTSKTQDTNSKRNPREAIGRCFLSLWLLLLPSWPFPLFLDSPTFPPSSFNSRQKETCLLLPSLDGNPCSRTPPDFLNFHLTLLAPSPTHLTSNPSSKSLDISSPQSPRLSPSPTSPTSSSSPQSSSSASSSQ